MTSKEIVDVDDEQQPDPQRPTADIERGGPQHAEDQGSLLARIKDAVPLRSIALGIGVLLLQTAFILAYVGAFHDPQPQDIKVAVVAPDGVSTQVAGSLNTIDDHPVRARVVGDRQTAEDQLKGGSVSAVYVFDPTGTTDELLVTHGGGSSVADAVTAVMQQATAAQGRTLEVTDLVPVQDGDARGLTGFYSVIGWLVGGYLVAAVIGVAKGSRPSTLGRGVVRLSLLVPYAVLSGLLGAVVIDPVLGAITGHFFALWGIGALVTYAAAAVTVALQVLFGIVGIGLTVLIFVVLGNPSAGGAYQPELLPSFWRTIHPWLPNGAATDAIRSVTYFGAENAARDLWTIVIWAVAGVTVALVASWLHARRNPVGQHAERHVAHHAEHLAT